ncbi:vomeronasal type-2 receptor 26-like [Xenopus laevis]|uniref:Vomeronasal type-2 receptor 26-like n=1 Tax=Xenopus laevis TaxID=8355 RepID=A0A8J1LUB8_XENLA|nr:vomeronasal type-2 receptor 26-like [Xenopus laevis]
MYYVEFDSATIWVTPCSTELSGSDSQCRIHLTKAKYEYKYIQDGDLIIGGVFSVNNEVYYIPDNTEKHIPLCVSPIISQYEDIMSLLFAIHEINKNPDLLPNITLGYHVYDSCMDPSLAIGSVLQILSGPGEAVPNYSCRGQGEIAGFIGDRSVVTSLPIAQLLGTYGYSQISFGAADPVLNDRTQYPYYFSIGPNEHIQHVAIAELVERLGWTWVVILARGDDYGERESKNLRDEINKHGVCVDFIGTLSEDNSTNYVTLQRIQRSTAEVVILCGGLFQSYSLAVLVESKIKDKTVVIPPLKSQCSANCPPGYRKVPRKGAPHCCYDCAKCSEGEISNSTDMENCLKCNIYEWPNQEKTMCIEKQMEFLPYGDDALSVAFIALSGVFIFIAEVILGIFILFQDTPVVKANNRNLSFILLVSIKLSFLCVFLFLGRPVDITCMFRQTSFGIIFSIAMSSVLAKTIMVCIAFKATKPGSPWMKWMGFKLAHSIVVICSFIQFVICVAWLAISPPFVEHNLSDPEKIIVQCNEGSDIAFYIVLAYMGLLASVSFIVAFLARTLPDSFNEAKYITFSMLLFCSVWITMIPAYLSTKGKYMVAVEIFAIITSSCGLLFCIFLPKCYIILLKPEMNTKHYLMGNNKQRSI